MTKYDKINKAYKKFIEVISKETGLCMVTRFNFNMRDNSTEIHIETIKRAVNKDKRT